MQITNNSNKVLERTSFKFVPIEETFFSGDKEYVSWSYTMKRYLTKGSYKLKFEIYNEYYLYEFTVIEKK